MKVHANSRLSPLGRQLMCERVRLQGWTVAEAAAANMSGRRTLASNASTRSRGRGWINHESLYASPRGASVRSTRRRPSMIRATSANLREPPCGYRALHT
jgi:hypothetical protein